MYRKFRQECRAFAVRCLKAFNLYEAVRSYQELFKLHGKKMHQYYWSEVAAKSLLFAALLCFAVFVLADQFGFQVTAFRVAIGLLLCVLLSMWYGVFFTIRNFRKREVRSK